MLESGGVEKFIFKVEKLGYDYFVFKEEKLLFVVRELEVVGDCVDLFKYIGFQLVRLGDL